MIRLVQVSVVSSKPTTEKLETQPEPVDLPNNIETDILESVPPTMKTRARQLVKKLKENKDLITWDDKAQLVYEGKLIPGSNVVDLVNDALRHRKNFNLHGWRLFAKALSDVNIPEEIVRNGNRLKTIQDYKIGALHQPEQEASSVATAPLLGVRPKARKRRAQLARRPYKWFK